jgi:hypothetical protein
MTQPYEFGSKMQPNEKTDFSGEPPQKKPGSSPHGFTRIHREPNSGIARSFKADSGRLTTQIGRPGLGFSQRQSRRDLRRNPMKNATVHSFSIALAGLVISGYWLFYVATVVAPRIA